MSARRIAGAVIVAGMALVGGQVATAADGVSASRPAVQPVMACTALAGQDFAAVPGAPTSITGAAVVPASGGTPEYCRVTGYVAPQIQFELRLPTTTWNGRYFQTGCGGFCGVIPIAGCAQALDADFAVAAENSGHVGGDALWAYDDRPLEIDWGYRSPHVVSIAAKAVIARFYGRGPAYSYFQGCSTGGRQALMEAQRFPHDFDGIIAGDPANRQNYLAPIAQGWVERANRDANGHLILTSDKLPLLNRAVLSDCDGLDGHADGVLDDPRACAFDPGSLECAPGQAPAECLTPAQVAVVRKIYAGPTDRHGRSLFPGLPRGSELGWAGIDIGSDTSLSGAGNFALQVLRYLAFKRDPGPSYQLTDFDFDRDPPKLRYMARIFNSDDPDMRAFRNAGGKLILYHGFADPLITPYSTIDYYRDAAAVSGGLAATQRWFRLFLLPGVYHCAGGPGADTVDWLTAIRQWVEDGRAPATTTARKLSGGQVTQTRVLQPFPAPPLQ
jgi:hypothetical protein